LSTRSTFCTFGAWEKDGADDLHLVGIVTLFLVTHFERFLAMAHGAFFWNEGSCLAYDWVLGSGVFLTRTWIVYTRVEMEEILLMVHTSFPLT
tara:strand:+ start:11774 stop:12052 length:279 start_codon:yes stop_codon:yes gene_type:complete